MYCQIVLRPMKAQNKQHTLHILSSIHIPFPSSSFKILARRDILGIHLSHFLIFDREMGKIKVAVHGLHLAYIIYISTLRTLFSLSWFEAVINFCLYSHNLPELFRLHCLANSFWCPLYVV